MEDNHPETQPPAVKYDLGKTRVELVAPEFLRACAEALTFGARKYSAGNWAGGMAWSRAYGALLRHVLAWAGGEEVDPESGLRHLAHAAACLMFLVAWSERAVGDDDRVKVGIQSQEAGR